MRKPRLFIGSSKEQVDLAYAVQENLEDDVEPIVWDQGVFELSKSAVESLIKETKRCDFALFVFAPDDITRIRKRSVATVRDNVLFEFGLFSGAIGRDRCFIVLPKGVSDFHLATDLLGMTGATFPPKRHDKNLQAALGPACNKVRKAMKRRGLRKDAGKNKQVLSLVIHKAIYGGTNGQGERRFVDVTEKLIALSTKTGLNVLVNNDLVGWTSNDPCPHTQKQVEIKYSYPYRSGIRHKVVAETHRLMLP